MAAPIDAGSIYSDVRIRLDRINGDIRAVKTGFDKLGTSITKSTDTTQKKTSKSFNKIGLAGVAAIGIITVAFKKAISIFAKTEQSLANVAAVSNATTEEFKALEAAAEAAGITTRFTASQAAEALFYLSSAGFSATESIAALDGVLLLAGATGSDLATTAQIVTSTLSQFSLESDKAADVANIFAAANSNSQATLDKLGGSLRQVGPVAAGLGIGLEELVGSLQALYNAGFRGEAAGRALKSALADLANGSSATIAKLGKLGIAFEDVDPTVVGLTGAIGALEKSGISTAEVIDAFGKVAGPQMVTLISAGEDAILGYTDAVTGTNEATRQYAVQNDTLAGSFDFFKSALEGASSALIKELAPILRGVLDLLTGFLRLFSQLPAVFKGLGVGAGVAAGGFLVLSKALAILGVTLSTGPLAIVALIGATTVGLVSLANSARKVKEEKLADEFKDLAYELGIAKEANEQFRKSAVNARASIIEWAVSGRSIAGLSAEVDKIAKELGLTRTEVLQIGIASKGVTKVYKDQLTELKRITAEQQLQRSLSAQTQREEQLLMMKELRIQAAREEAELEKDAIERANRLEKINERALLLDELALEGVIKEEEALEEKIALRIEEKDLLLQQALDSGKVTAAVIRDSKAQQDSIDGYIKRLDTLNKQKEDDAKKDEARNAESLTDKKEFWDSIVKLNLDRLIEEEADADKAAEDEKKASYNKAKSYIDIYEQAADAVTDLVSQNAEDAIQGVGDKLIEVGAQTGNKYAAIIGAAIKVTKDLFDALNTESLTFEDVMFNLFAPFGPQITKAVKKAEAAVTKILSDTSTTIEQNKLVAIKKGLDDAYELKKKAIDDDYDDQIDNIERVLSAEQILTLQNLGILEETRADYYGRVTEEAITQLKDQLEEEVELNAENEETILGQTIARINAELAANTELLEELSDEEQAYIDFKNGLAEIEDAEERAAKLKQIADLILAGKTAEADLLQLKLDNEDKLEALKDAAELAEEERIAKIAELERVAAAEKTKAKENELALLTTNSQAEIDAITSVFNAQQAAEVERQAADKAYKVAIAKYEHQKAIFDKEVAISEAEANKIVAVSEVPWYKSGSFGNTDDVVGDMFDTLIAQIKSTPIPSLPSYQTGGIVLPKSSGTLVNVAENGYAETLYNDGPSGQAHTQQMAAEIAKDLQGNVTVQIYKDGRKDAEDVVRYINNGIVRIDI